MIRTACAIALATAFAARSVAAVEPVAPHAPVPTVRPAVAERPALGVEIDVNSGSFDKGLPITVVRPGSTAAAIGMQPGDAIKAINGKAVAAPDEIQKVLADLKVGDAITVDVLRANAAKQLTGTLQPRAAAGSIGGDIGKTKHDIEVIQQQLDASRRDPSLAEVIALLNRFEEQLPKAAEQFKKQYPNGEFKITIAINIVSDKNAKNPIDLINTPPDTGKPDPAKDGAKADPAKDDAGAKDDKTKPAVDQKTEVLIEKK